MKTKAQFVIRKVVTELISGFDRFLTLDCGHEIQSHNLLTASRIDSVVCHQCSIEK